MAPRRIPRTAVAVDVQSTDRRLRFGRRRVVLLVGELPRGEQVELTERGAIITDAPDTHAAFELLASSDFDVVVVDPFATGNGLDLVTAVKEGEDAHLHTVATLHGSRGSTPFLRGARLPNEETLATARVRHRVTPFVVLAADGSEHYAIVAVPPDASFVKSRRVLPLATAILTVKCRDAARDYRGDGLTRCEKRRLRPERKRASLLRGLSTVLLLGVAFVGLPALACDCMPPKFEKELAGSEAVFVGRVVAINADGVAFDASASWKGPGPTVLLEDGKSDCAFLFEVGRDYLVFARADKDGSLSASAPHCSLTRRAEDAREEIARLGPPSAHYESPAGLRPSAVTILASAAVFAVLVLAAVRRVHRSRQAAR